MKILYLTYFFGPEIGAASVRATDVVKILIEKGNEVDVLAPLPHYPYGKIYPNYKNELNGAKIYRIESLLSSNSDSTLKRLRAQYDFFVKAKKFKLKKQYDLIISSTPPLFVSWLGDILSRKLKIPHIVDVRDLWPESIVETKMVSPYNPIVIYAKHISNKVISNATLLISPVKGILRRFPTKRSLWIPNSLTPLQEPRRNDNKKLRCIYAGTIGYMQNVELLNDLKSDYADFVVVGAGKNTNKLRNVNYLGSMSRIETIKEINKSDVGLVLMKHNKDFFKDALPSKIFEYIAYGKPIISNLLGETAAFLKENKCGITISGSQESLKAAVEFLAKNRDFYDYLSRNALKTSAKYSKTSGIIKMLELISNEK